MAKKLNYDPNEKCTQAIVFARVSSKKQKDKGVSLDVQMETITQYCIDNGLKVIKDLSIDESSTRGERKQYHEMLEFAKNHDGKIAIIVNYVDRLQRSYDDTYELNRLRKEGKIEIHFLKEGLIITKDSAAMDLTFWNMHVLMANFQVNTMIDKVKASQKQNWADGKWQGLAPIGYLNARDNDRKATLIIDEQRAPIIKILFEEYATGLHSLQSLWYKAKELGLTSKEKNHYEKSKNFNKRTFVSRNKIEDILKNPFYYGMMKIKGNLIPHIYEPIISKALFDKVQEVFQSKSREVFSHQQEYKAIPFAFRGLIKCETCGCAITSEHKIKKNGKRYVYLKCSHLRGNCKQGLVNENTLFEQLDNELFSKIQIPSKILETLKKNVQKNMEEEAIMNANLKRNLQSELNTLVNKEDNLTDLYVSGKIKENIYNRQINAIADERTFLEESIAKYKEITKDITTTVDNLLDIAGNLSDIMHKASPLKKNKLLKLLIKDCTLQDKTLKYTVRAPFDKFIQCNNPTQWFKDPTQDLDTYAKIADEVKMVKQQVLLTC